MRKANFSTYQKTAARHAVSKAIQSKSLTGGSKITNPVTTGTIARKPSATLQPVNRNKKY